jgi:hypothetical protein
VKPDTQLHAEAVVHLATWLKLHPLTDSELAAAVATDRDWVVAIYHLLREGLPPRGPKRVVMMRLVTLALDDARLDA